MDFVDFQHLSNKIPITLRIKKIKTINTNFKTCVVVIDDKIKQ